MNSKRGVEKIDEMFITVPVTVECPMNICTVPDRPMCVAFGRSDIAYLHVVVGRRCLGSRSVTIAVPLIHQLCVSLPDTIPHRMPRLTDIAAASPFTHTRTPTGDLNDSRDPNVRTDPCRISCVAVELSSRATASHDFVESTYSRQPPVMRYGIRRLTQ